MTNTALLLDHRLGIPGGGERHLLDYRGDVLLVVNTASECGFTKQYAALQKLHEDYAARGLRVLGFPCNQFRGQEPGTDAEIAQFCDARFGVKFELFAKTDVKGDGAPARVIDLQQKAVGRRGPDGAAPQPEDQTLDQRIGDIVKANII